MNSATRPVLTLAVAFGLLASVSAYAQPDNQPVAPTPVTDGTTAAPAPAPTASSAEAALKKQAGDVDQATLLKDTLTKTDRSYSLLKAGRISANYDLNYSYIGSEAIDVGFSQGTSSIDLFRIETTRAHTITNSFSVDYGLLDNLTVTTSVPFVSKFTQSTEFSGIANGIGDLSVGARYQPFVQNPTGPTFTFTSSLNVPTGRSPYKQIIGQNLATGSGYWSGTVGMNASQVFDPVALYGSLNFTLAKSVDDLNQENPADSTVLTSIKPGKGVGFGAGFTYALSYNISTSVSFQESVTTGSWIHYNDANGTPQAPRKTAMQVAGLLNFGLGVRLNPKTTLNLSAGVGLTTDSPDFSLGLDVPLTFSMF